MPLPASYRPGGGALSPRSQTWPKDLQELVPAYLPSRNRSLRRKPLKFAHREDGISLLGDKTQDDVATIHKQSPDDDEPRDLGVRLWNPDIPAAAPKEEVRAKGRRRGE